MGMRGRVGDFYPLYKINLGRFRERERERERERLEAWGVNEGKCEKLKKKGKILESVQKTLSIR